MNHDNPKGLSRRDLLRWSLAGVGGLTLQSLATGLPIDFLRTGSTAHANTTGPATFLILATSSGGDPLNANCFGSYPNPADLNDVRHTTEHPLVSQLGSNAFGTVGGVAYGAADFETGVECTVGGDTTWAARPWADLPDSLRSRMAVIRHRTYTNAHPEFTNVTTFHGGVKGPGRIGVESLPAMIAQETAPLLGTTLTSPMRVGGPGYSASGQPVRDSSPDTLQNLFSEAGEWRGLQSNEFADMRDLALDAIYADVQSNGTHAQKRFLDAHARGREDARALSEVLSTALAPIASSSDDVEKQVLAAVALIEHAVSPVITIQLPFGGDNHQDTFLETEVTEQLAGIEGIRRLHEELTLRGLLDQVTFANLFVFQRPLTRGNFGGRGHYGDDNCMVTFGPNIPTGLHGGVDADLKAGPIDDVPIDETLAAAGKTLACACGVPEDVLEDRIVGGRVLT